MVRVASSFFCTGSLLVCRGNIFGNIDGRGSRLYQFELGIVDAKLATQRAISLYCIKIVAKTVRNYGKISLILRKSLRTRKTYWEPIRSVPCALQKLPCRGRWTILCSSRSLQTSLFLPTNFWSRWRAKYQSLDRAFQTSSSNSL